MELNAVTEGCHSPDFDRPNMRIVLLGKSLTENIRVRNSILGIDVKENETSSDILQNHSLKISGTVENRHITVINNANLLQLNLTQFQITERVKDCIKMSAPGPHVLILVLQHHDFSEEDRNRIKHVLEAFTDPDMKRTTVLTTDEKTHSDVSTSVKMNAFISDLIKMCGGGHLQFDEGQPEWRSEMFSKVEILKKESDEYLKCDIFVDAEGSSVDRVEEDQGSHKKGIDIAPGSVKKLNVVLCGTDATLKVIMSKLLRGKLKKHLNQREFSSSVCVKKEEKVQRRLISVVELPALTQLSHEEMMCQTFNAVSLCDPGVHVFLIIIPVGLLTDEHKEEMEKIQKIFYFIKHFMLIFTTEFAVDKGVTDFVESYTECQRLIHLCEGRHRVIGLKEHKKFEAISRELLDNIDNMKTEPYSLQMYARAQEMRGKQETEEKYKEKLSEMTSQIKELQLKINLYGGEGEQENLTCLRIVLIGKTGNGKSATGNTILGEIKFESQLSLDSVTTVCVKGVGEVEGRSVAVVDTPGLFDTTLSKEEVIDEIMKCVSLSAPGPHVFIIVLRLDRFTQEEADTIDLIKMFFGPKVAQFSIILFTRGDDLQGETIEHFVNRSKNKELKKLLRDCGNRFLAFNNREKQDRTQVNQLLNIIEEMKTSNQGRYFTNSMFEEAEMSIKKQMEKILKEKEREIQSQKEELKASYEMEKVNMMKRLEIEKQQAAEEKVQMEKTFKEKEETLRKQFEEKERRENQKRVQEKQKQSEEEKQRRADYDQKIEEMMRQNEHQRSLYEQQQREREEQDRKREEKYRQDQEKMKDKEDLIIQLKKNQEVEIKKRDSEEQRRREQEERERQEWTRKIKEAENDRKDIQEKIKQQQREWEEDKKRQMREREEYERKRRDRHEEELKEKQEEVEKMRKTLEKEREEERRNRDEERQKQGQEKEEKEREYQEKKNEIMKHYEQLERERKEMWERKQREDDERKEEERTRWEKRIDDINREKEEEIRTRQTQEKKRKEREEKKREEIKEDHEGKIKEMKKKHEDKVRKQAEEFNEFRERNEQHVQELKQMLEERQKQHELLEKLYQHFKQQKGDEIEELRNEVEKLRNKSSCVIL